MRCDEAIKILDPETSYATLMENMGGKWDMYQAITLMIKAERMALEALREKQSDGWISVKDRLPDNGKRVLCWYEYFRYGDSNCMFETYGIGYQYNGAWGGEIVIGKNAKVLAWQPLPEPPKGDSNGD